MQSSEKAKFLQVLVGVHDFYGRELSEFAAEVWLQACEAFEVSQVSKALSAHLMDAERGQFMPKPADIVRQLQGTQADRSLVAWGKVLDAMQRVGAYQSVVFDDGAIHAAIEDMGGWMKVCRSNTDELQFTQKRFTDLHRAYSNRPDLNYPARLVGEHELTNSLQGQKTDPPTLIGDAERAKQIAAGGVTGSKTAITAGDALASAVKLIGNKGA